MKNDATDEEAQLEDETAKLETMVRSSRPYESIDKSGSPGSWLVKPRMVDSRSSGSCVTASKHDPTVVQKRSRGEAKTIQFCAFHRNEYA
jgi:hypothetical protein